jgi:hypothetical protein
LSKNMTYMQLLDKMEHRVGQTGMPSRSSLENAKSALRGLVRTLRLQLNSKVGLTLRDDFEAALEAHRRELQREGLKLATINNQTPLLEPWRLLVRTLDHECANELEQRTPFQLKLDELYATRTDMKHLVAQAGLNRDRLRLWRMGGSKHLPKPKSVPKIRRLGVLCGIGNELVELLPSDVRLHRAVRPPVAPIKYRELLKEMMEDEYKLKPEEWTTLLRSEWAGLFVHKVPAVDPNNGQAVTAYSNALANGSSSAEQARQKERERLAQEYDVTMKTDVSLNGEPWRAREKGRYTQNFPDWVNVVGENIYPSAGGTFSVCQAFLGWALKSEDEGGPLLPKKRKRAGDKKLLSVDQLTLGLFANSELLEQFLRWRVVKSVGVNAFFFNFLNLVRSLLREKTGYLWRNPEIGKRVGVSNQAAWRQQCKVTHAWAGEKKGNFKNKKKQSRNPAEPIKELLALERPLAGFREGIQCYAGVRRRSHSAWAQSRNVALLCVSISNPVRLTNLQTVTHKPDYTGHFRKREDGLLWLEIPKEEFKNIKGAAKDRDYAQPLSPLATQYLTAYLENYWPGRDCESGLVFVTKRHPDHIWDGMSDTYRALTRTYMLGNHGFGPHSTRYLVGSAILMASHGNIRLAANALHDAPSTVERCYAKLLEDFTARSVGAAIGIDMATNDADLAEFVSTRALATAMEAPKRTEKDLAGTRDA